MYKKKYSKNPYDISEEEYHELCKQPGANEVVEAVRQYNKQVLHSRIFEDAEGNALWKKEAEEEETKIFLDGIFDLAEKRNS
jgi:hypothetical protein